MPDMPETVSTAELLCAYIQSAQKAIADRKTARRVAVRMTAEGLDGTGDAMRTLQNRMVAEIQADVDADIVQAIQARNIGAVSMGTQVAPGAIPVHQMAPPRRVTVPEFEMVSNPTVRIDDIRSRRFPMMTDMVVDTLRTRPVQAALGHFDPSWVNNPASLASINPCGEIPLGPQPEPVQGPPAPSVWERLDED